MSGTITILDTATNAVVSVIHLGFDRNPFGVVFTADGTRAYVEQRSEFLNVIDTATNTVVIDALQNLFHDHLAITPDHTRLYVTTPVISSVFVIDTSTNAVVNTIPLSYSPIFPAMTSDGTRVYTVNVQDTVSVIDTATNTVTATISGFACPLRMAITPVPKSKDDCKNGGYGKFRALAFANQGQCVKYVNRHAN